VRLALTVCALALLLPAGASALPEFSVESARACNTCHVAPEYWKNPETALRKCTLSCNGCHVNPSGGGPRHVAGEFYGSHHLGLFKWGSVNVGPAPGGVPAPGTPARFDGLDPSPRLDVRGDFRVMGYSTTAEFEDDAFFPMQADVHLIARPYNPKEQNRGRLTLVATGGAEGKRNRADDEDVTDYLFVKEWWLLYHDMPQQAYVKVGRFLPPFGWRLDDHTAYIRQALGFDHERQVTGVEVGLNPNYPYVHAAVFTSTHDGHSPLPDDGRGAALSIGYRDLAWQLGGSAMFETREDADEVWVGTSFALNLFRASHPWKGLRLAPFIYMGEVDLRRTDPNDGDREITGLAAFHQLTWIPRPWLRVGGRYEWRDFDVEIEDDHRQRLVGSVTVHPVPQLEIGGYARKNLEPGDTIEDDELLLMIHVWR
jgi:hypothetical protein